MDNPNNSPKGVLQVLFLASEACPLIKVGGLADVAGSLPHALRSLDPQDTGGYLLDVRLAIPFHGAIKVSPSDVTPVTTFNVMKNGQPVEARVFLYDHHGLPVYLIAGDPIPPEATVYSMNTAVDGDKYIFFSLAALKLARALNWQPDVIHANDWHSAAAVYALELEKQTDAFFANTYTLLCVHNLPFMGAGTSSAVAAYGLPPSDDPDLPDWARMFPLPMGLSKAEQIVTVSPSYAREILTPQFGLGLEGFLRTRADRLEGILNGLDQGEWDPVHDTALVQTFSMDTLEQRAENKKALQAEFGFPVSADTPLLVMVSRMEYQKGVDILVEGLRMVVDQNWQCILLGSGDPKLENDCRHLEADLPDRVKAAIRFDPNLSRRMYGGADMLIMPSHYEPCGLVQMISMHYGCIPVASAVGGLRDTIIDLPGQPARSTGYLFNEVNAHALANTLRRALADFEQRDLWRERQRCAMQQNFSWKRSAIEYSQIYTKWRNKE